jgi:NDP-sugar pyrophosphorylase family protein
MSREMKIRHALIMAAGRGNRMRPLTNLLPKPMLPYKKDTLIGNSLSMLSSCVEYIHVTVGYKKAMLAEYLMTKGVDSIFNTEGYGNAWWISNTLMQFLDEPVLVLTTDNITEIDMGFLQNEYSRLHAPPCMLVPVSPIVGIEGDFIERDGDRVLSLQRRMPTEIYCSGIQVLNPVKINKAVGAKDDFLETWNSLIALQILVTAKTYPKVWFSVDTLEQLASVQNV